MSLRLYSTGDYFREMQSSAEGEPWRSEFFRDYGRVIHSSSFRRLQGKTQVFPVHESDFFRNRLTHSLEVGQIAEGIAERLNHVEEFFKKEKLDLRLIATASLVHDLGHPPFGHNGERALDDEMRGHGGFEGNAQTLRILARSEKKVRTPTGVPKGLNLTYRALAAAIKYDREIPRSRRKDEGLIKGYYSTEANLVKDIKTKILGKDNIELKTIECQIMDIADDIAYSTFDLEDCLKAGFLSPGDMLTSSETLLTEVANKVQRALGETVTIDDVQGVFLELFMSDRQEKDAGEITKEAIVKAQMAAYRMSKTLGESGYLRTPLSSQLVKEAINSIILIPNEDFPMLSKVRLKDNIRRRVEILKQYTFTSIIYSSRVKVAEYRGYEVVKGIFQALSDKRGQLLMPEDVRQQYADVKGDYDKQMRIVCDFVAGMTDRYAMEFFGRLHSDGAQSMFKPL